MRILTFFSGFPVLFFLILGCGEKAPIEVDGQVAITIYVADSSGVFSYNPGLGFAPVPGARVLIQSVEYGTTFSSVTDSQGKVEFHNLAASIYRIMAHRYKILGGKELSLSAQVEKPFYLQDSFPETLYCSVSERTALVIHEIYYCGPVNSSFYVSDQYIELLNRSDSTIYLDGIILARSTQAINPDKETNSYAEALYSYRFPGEPGGKKYPLSPKSYCIIAQDAFDHKSVVSTSIDLSGADWEFYDQFGGDFDNFQVPNVLNMRADKPRDFYLNLTHGAVILANGTEISVQGDYVRLPLSTILDAVEYGTSASYQKLLSVRLDAGLAGVGLQPYSGKSIQRKNMGEDTNNSTFDFQILDAPTPGF